MSAERYSYWITYVVPAIAVASVWKSYDSLAPKVAWYALMAAGYLFLPSVGASALSFVVLLIHVFVLYLKKQRDDSKQREEVMAAAMKAQRNNYH